MTAPALARLHPTALRAGLRRGRERLGDRWVLLVQIGVAVALAWFLARTVLGHPQPFFAPVTAIISLGLTYGQRLRRIAEVTMGVAIGVFVGDVIVLSLGSGAWQMALVVVVAMTISVLVSSGQLIVIQSGVQSVFIVAFAANGDAALSRWLDAVMGGVVALLIGAVAPAAPVERPWREAARTVRAVSVTLHDAAAALRSRDAGSSALVLADARALEDRLEGLRTAASEGLAVVRQSPLLRSRREQASAAHRLVVPLDRCVRNLRVLARRVDAAVVRGEDVPPGYTDLVVELAGAVDALGRALDTRSTPSAARAPLERVARLSAVAAPGASLSAEMIRGQVRSMVLDLLVVAGLEADEARRLVPDSHRP